MIQKLRVASLFSGCGGTDIGVEGGFDFLGVKFQRLPTEVVYANDIEVKACDIFDLNFKVKADRRDIRLVKEDEIPEHDILTAGFPCQSFSILAQNPPRLGYKDDRGKLFFEIVRILNFHKPKYFVCENVKGILSSNQGKTFPLILEEFKKCGYRVAYKLLNSKDFGVPQKRERVFIVGIRSDLPPYDFDFPETELILNKETPLSLVLESNVENKYFFSDKAVKGLLRSKRKTNNLMNKGRDQDPGQPCNTVTAHLSKVTLNGTDPVFKVKGRYRRFTPREVARIQSFPESFKLVGSDSSQYKALGNAIPPVVFWQITRNICNLNESIINGTFKKKKRINQHEQLALEF